ncbi:MAG: hypothetical protein M3Y72_17900 [Acidobacteriota bacterium]|nr:hypothetical protein [Acidobacteriota bacterium]
MPTPPRFPALSTRVGKISLALLPFPGFPHGWGGSLEQFLDAVRTGKIALESAPLVAVIEQYLAQREGLGLDETAEGLYLAAALCDWKARLLLPRDPALAQPDPREQLVEALEHEIRRSRPGLFPAPETAQPADRHPAGLSLLDLMVLLHQVEQRALSPATVLNLTEPEITVADQIRWLQGQWPGLAAAPTDAESLFAQHPSRLGKNCLFLALLEIAKQRFIVLEQTETFQRLTVACAANL